MEPIENQETVDVIPHYRPSGRVNPGRFALMLPCGLIIALLMVAGLFLSDLFFYMPLLTPLILGLGVAGGVWLVVHFGKCRNSWVGAVMGLVLGLVCYLGFWGISYAHFVVTAGTEGVQAIDEVTGTTGIASYFKWRCKTNMIHEAGRETTRKPGKADEYANTLFYTLELLLVCGMCGAVGWTKSRRVFYENYGKWASSAKTRFNKGHAGQVIAAAASHNWAALGEIPRQSAMQKSDHVVLRVQFLKEQPDEQAYLTLESIRDGQIRKIGQQMGFDIPAGYLKGMPLPAGAIGAIGAALPELGVTAGAAPGAGQSRVQYASGLKGVLQKAGLQAATISGPDFRGAAVEASNAALSGMSMKPGTEARMSLCLAIEPKSALAAKDIAGIGRRVEYAFIGMTLGGFGLVALALAFGDPNGKDLTPTGTAIAISGAAVVVLAILLISFSGVLHRKLAGARMLQRPGALFEPRAGSKMMLFHLEDAKTYHVGKKTPEDVVLCLFDVANHRLLMEGCAYRYIVQGQDVEQLVQLSAMEVDAVQVTYRVGETELALVLAKKNYFAAHLNPWIRSAIAKRFYKKIAVTLAKG